MPRSGPRISEHDDRHNDPQPRFGAFLVAPVDHLLDHLTRFR